MRRRDFIKGIVCSTLAWPLPARAQQPGRIRLVAVLMSAADTDPQYQADLAAFDEGIDEFKKTIRDLAAEAAAR